MKHAALIGVFMLAFAALPVLADDGHDRTVDAVRNEILLTQTADRVADIQCADVDDAQWEALGDAVMSLMHPDDETHEAMDAMMGGEGSASLRAAHIQMGRQYLGCGTASAMPMYGGMMMSGGMGGSGFWNTNQEDFSSRYRSSGGMMMGGWPFGAGAMAFGWLSQLIILGLAITGLVWIVQSLRGAIVKK